MRASARSRRFKLLAFVPTLSGAGVALLSRQGVPNSAKAGVGVLGFLVSLGIFFYDRRNTQLYAALVRRAKALEGGLPLRSTTGDLSPDTPAGQFAEGPEEILKLFRLIPIRHGEGLALIYSAVLAGWAFVALDGFLSVRRAAPFAAGVGLIFLLEMTLGFKREQDGSVA